MKKKHIAFKLLRILSMTPILLWPIVFIGSIFFGTIFFFDGDLSSNLSIWGFIGINGYPLLLIWNLVLSNKAYSYNKTLAYLLLCWPLLFFLFFSI